ncbi:MAG: ABC transporter substrate-binding protein [Anaerolineae bacterium]|nr:ABC transporter substrate-binding protein [Anaerolineae bacterium]
MNPGHQNKRKMSRREFLHLTAVTAAGIVATRANVITGVTVEAESYHSTDKVVNGQPAAFTSAQTYHEAPMLAELVRQGRLPPVEERLPINPCVIPVLHQTGKYDNVMNRAFKGVSDRWGPTKMIDHSLVWYDSNLNLIPHLCESWEPNADASVWTFHLREGTKWSDGANFTSADFVWWYENVLTDTRLYATPPSRWTADGEVMTLEAPDAQTVVMSFSQPNVLFIYNLARSTDLLCPSHYMRQYHIDFASEPVALEAEAAAAGYASWGDYYLNNRDMWYLNPSRPQLGPWLAKNTADQNLFVMERNPYYYGVDVDDNQLPYVDSITHNLFAVDAEFIAWVQSGAIDFQARHANIAYYNDYKAYEAAGGYHVVLGVNSSHVALQLNMTAPLEPDTLITTRRRDFFQDVRVRKALSLAVDRTYLNNQFYNGLAIPRQYSPLSTSPQYYSTLSNAYIAYDVVQANALLDDAGYTVKDGAGYRLWKDSSGERVSFTIEGTAEATSADGKAVLQVIQYYAAVGVEATYQYVDRATYTEHYQNNQIEAAWWGGDRTILPIVSGAIIFRGTQLDRPWAVAWGAWYNDPTNPIAEEPPAGHWIRDIWSKWDEIRVEPSETQRNALFREILDIWAQQLPMIGYLGEVPQPVIMKNGLHNYDAGYPIDDTTGDEQLLNPETYYWDSPFTPELDINYTTGSPGSFFTLTGSNYPPNSTAMVSINGNVIQTLFTDESGNIEFVLNTDQADVGYYEVTVSVNPSASMAFELAMDEPQREQEDQVPVVPVPPGIAINKIYLPLVQRSSESSH